MHATYTKTATLSLLRTAWPLFSCCYLHESLHWWCARSHDGLCKWAELGRTPVKSRCRLGLLERERGYAAVKLIHVDWRHICNYTCIKCDHNASGTIFRSGFQFGSQSVLKTFWAYLHQYFHVFYLDPIAIWSQKMHFNVRFKREVYPGNLECILFLKLAVLFGVSSWVLEVIDIEMSGFS